MKLVFVCGFTTHAFAEERQKNIPALGIEAKIPVTAFRGVPTAITEFAAYGPWPLPERAGWLDAPGQLSQAENDRFLWTQLEAPPFSSKPQLLKSTGDGVDFSPFVGLTRNWTGNHVTLLACRVIASERFLAMLEIAHDDGVNIYQSGKSIGNVGDWLLPKGGEFHAIPVQIEKGENVFLFKPLSTGRAPQFKVRLISDQSRDFNAAWGPREGLLSKLIYIPNKEEDKPVVQWNALLKDMAVRAEIRTANTGENVETIVLHRGDPIQIGGAPISDGIYAVHFSNESGEATENILVGEPRKIKAKLNLKLRTLPITGREKINAETLMRRLEVLCKPGNYAMEDLRWQKKVAYTAYSLDYLIGQVERGVKAPGKDEPGLHIRGFASQVDASIQHYRLYIPHSYKRGSKVPVLVIMPTVVAATHRPFIESAFIADHREALRVSSEAERFGFAVLWPGYRNAPNSELCENAHLDEALRAMGEDYDIDLQRISLYGYCSGGIFAGNATAKWPHRFAAIVYDNAIFHSVPRSLGTLSKDRQDWLHVKDPVDSVLANKDLAVFVKNTGHTGEGNGEIALSLAFLEKAKKYGKSVTVDFSKNIVGNMTWDKVFTWVTPCKLGKPSMVTADRFANAGYVGPIADILGTPFVIIEGTQGSKIENEQIKTLSRAFQAAYGNMFYQAACRVAEDNDISASDLETRSLILLGNSSSNKIWQNMEPRIPLRVNELGVQLGDQRWLGKSVFQGIFKNPYAKERYILFLGSTDLAYLKLLPIDQTLHGWFDFGLWQVADGKSRPIVTSKMRDLVSQKIFEEIIKQ